MCSRLWFLTDRRIGEDYPQLQILRALRQRCAEQNVQFRALLMDQLAVTVVGGHLGLQVNREALTTFPDVVLVRVATPSVQSDSDITVLRHLEKLGCRLVNRPQSILNCINKFWTFQELAGHGVPMPDTFSYGGHDDFAKMIDEAEPLGYPVVVKSTRGHRGKAVFLARDKHHLSDICHLIRHDAPYLFQKGRRRHVSTHRARQAVSHSGLQHLGHGLLRHRSPHHGRRLLRRVRGQRQRRFRRLRPGVQFRRRGDHRRLHHVPASRQAVQKAEPPLRGARPGGDRGGRGVGGGPGRPRERLCHQRGIDLQRERPRAGRGQSRRRQARPAPGAAGPQL
ncbi:N-acetylaspartylglutamate synthase A isoform X2 [Ornithorhynchus anatinus]|uniref:N-acetylaspartylglutamate synthase A isoform X2 n=1 Tax=Ornithorhynchus anatinus TaxID=9258 RepID=UPI0010A8231A|nr:N-acetylaspartylglutamate synthase A isoform X2 [Ornithorhynchus anatinus]